MGLDSWGVWCEQSAVGRWFTSSEPCPAQFPYNGTSVLLFDLEQDPGEGSNVAAERLEVVEQLSEVLWEEWDLAVEQWL